MEAVPGVRPDLRPQPERSELQDGEQNFSSKDHLQQQPLSHPGHHLHRELPAAAAEERREQPQALVRRPGDAPSAAAAAPTPAGRAAPSGLGEGAVAAHAAGPREGRGQGLREARAAGRGAALRRDRAAPARGHRVARGPLGGHGQQRRLGLPGRRGDRARARARQLRQARQRRAEGRARHPGGQAAGVPAVLRRHHAQRAPPCHLPRRHPRAPVRRPERGVRHHAGAEPEAGHRRDPEHRREPAAGVRAAGHGAPGEAAAQELPGGHEQGHLAPARGPARGLPHRQRPAAEVHPEPDLPGQAAAVGELPGHGGQRHGQVLLGARDPGAGAFQGPHAAWAPDSGPGLRGDAQHRVLLQDDRAVAARFLLDAALPRLVAASMQLNAQALFEAPVVLWATTRLKMLFRSTR
mmetsp:Transcript_93541/g.273925  ORF Transcript_93541/g.273925 Transcript_93541/m.273925 type:complete len:409 (-) Transcript_93541:35-1261(-)